MRETAPAVARNDKTLGAEPYLSYSCSLFGNGQNPVGIQMPSSCFCSWKLPHCSLHKSLITIPSPQFSWNFQPPEGNNLHFLSDPFSTVGFAPSEDEEGDNRGCGEATVVIHNILVSRAVFWLPLFLLLFPGDIHFGCNLIRISFYLT